MKMQKVKTRTELWFFLQSHLWFPLHIAFLPAPSFFTISPFVKPREILSLLQSHQDDHPLTPSEQPWDSEWLTAVPGNTFSLPVSVISEKKAPTSLTYKVVFIIKYMMIHVDTRLVIVFISKYRIDKINVIIKHTRREINYIIK